MMDSVLKAAASDLLALCLIGFVGMALCLYLVLGGADYGAGMLELLPARGFRARQKTIINHALGPVWEANHMWLIIIVVILFIGFPLVFRVVMVALHWPMVALLWGIVLRGAVFTFRHYDAVKGPRSQRVYTVLFGLSSLWTSLWIGIIAASLFRGRIDPGCHDVWDAYVAPWWGLFPLSVGIFVSALFAFLAGVFLVGETRDPALRRFFAARAACLHLGLYATGGLVFWAASRDDNQFLVSFWQSRAAWGCIGIAALCAAVLWGVAWQRSNTGMRLAAAGHNTAIVWGWYIIHAPNALVTTAGPLSFFTAAAAQATCRQLVFALSMGSMAIFPSLFLLLVVFKHRTQAVEPSP
jgi:cytochrome d ubiquinol oxidase subunit II